MKLLRPFTVTDANLTSSVAEAGTYPEYASTATYAAGDQVMDTARSGATHHVYESIVSGNVGNALTDSSKWLDIGPTNRFAMFDQKNGTATTDTAINVSVAVTGRADGLALLGLDAQQVYVSMAVDATTHTNLLTYSEQFDNAAWTKDGATVTANAGAAPDGSMTADRISTGTSTGEHRIYQSAGSSAVHGFSIYAKEDTARYVSISTGTIAQYATFDLRDGTVLASADVTASSESLGSGWYRLSVNGSSAMPANFFVLNVGETQIGATPAQGTTGSDMGILAFGAQLQTDEVTAYIPTTSAPVTSSSGTVFEQTYDLLETAAITSWYAWFTEEVTYKTDLLITDLPLYTNPTLRALITGDGSVSCGSMVLGQTRELGMALYGARAGINDYSRKDTDDFGNYTIVERAFAKRTILKLVTDNTDIDSIHALLAAYRVTPAVWIGADDYACTWVFGFYKAFDVEIAMMEKSYVTLEIEGLT